MRSRSCGGGVAGKELAKRVLAKIRDELARDQLSDPINKPWREFVEEFMGVQ